MSQFKYSNDFILFYCQLMEMVLFSIFEFLIFPTKVALKTIMKLNIKKYNFRDFF